MNILKDMAISYTEGKAPSLFAFARATEKVSRYKLAAKPTFFDYFNYCIYRICNAVKAIFNNSDWQHARKEMSLTTTLELEGLYVYLSSRKDFTGVTNDMIIDSLLSTSLSPPQSPEWLNFQSIIEIERNRTMARDEKKIKSENRAKAKDEKKKKSESSKNTSLSKTLSSKLKKNKS